VARVLRPLRLVWLSFLAACFLDQLTSSGPKPGDIQFTLNAADTVVILGGTHRVDFNLGTGEGVGPTRIRWTSSAPNIATVDTAGVVHALLKGSVIITARVTAPELDTGVTRLQDVRVAYGSISIDPVDSITGLGDTRTLVVRGHDSVGTAVDVIPNGTVTFNPPADPTVVGLNPGGVVVAKKEGQTNLTATFEGLTSGTVNVKVHQIAKSITFGVGSVVFPALQRDTTVSITIKDTHDSIIVAPAVTWSSVDPTAVTVNASTGVMRAIKVAATTIHVTRDTVTASLSTSVVQVPKAIVAISGDSAADTVGRALSAPQTVQVRDAGGAGVPNVKVTYVVTSGGGSIAPSPDTAISDASGNAAAGAWTLGTAAGVNNNKLTATSGALAPYTFTASARASHAKHVARIAGDSQSAIVGHLVAIQPQVQVTDTFGNVVSNVPVAFAVTAGGGGASGTGPTTDASGLATVGSWTLGTIKGTNRLRAAISGDTASFTATGTAATAKILVPAAGANQTATVGSLVPIPPSVRVTDSLGNGVQGVAVTFTATAANGIPFDTVKSTDANGLATIGSWTLDTIAGADTLRASATGLPDTLFTATATAGAPASITATAGDHQIDTVAQALPVAPSVIVRDQYRNPKPGALVTFAVIGGGGSVGGASQSTTAGGVATVGSWTLGQTSGTNNNLLRASVGAIADTFVATAKPDVPVTITKVSGDAQVGTPGSPLPSPYIVRVTDQFNNGVPSVTVVWRATTGGGTMNGSNPDTTLTDPTGFAQDLHILGTTPGAQTASAASSGLAGSPIGFTATANSTPTQIVLVNGNNQTAAVNTNVATAPSVKVTDGVGNPSAGVAVTFAVASGGGSATGLVQSTNALGIATVGSWKLGIGAGSDNNTLTATSSGLTGSPITFTASATAGPADTVFVNAGGTQTGTVGAAVATRPSVKVTDQFGNPVAGVQVSFAPPAGSGSVTGATDTTNALGIAVVGSWTLGTVAGANKDTLIATSGTLGGNPVIFVASANAGAAAQIAVAPIAGNNITDTVALPVYLPPAVLVTDQFANPVGGVAVNFAVVSGGGSVTGASQTTGANGVAIVTSWTLGNSSGVNNNSLVASSGTLAGSPVIFTATAVNGVATKIAAFQGSGQTATVNSVLPINPAATVTDQFNNPVAGVSVTFAAAAGSGSVTGGSATTDTLGHAFVTTWKIGTTAGVNRDTVRATSSGLTGSPVVFTASGTAGTLAQMTKSAGDNQSAVAGSPVTVPPQVFVSDSFGNAKAGVQVVFGVVFGGGSSTGDSALSDVNGHAAVGSWTLGPFPDTNNLQAFVPGAPSLVAIFRATGGASGPTQMALNAGDSQTDSAGSTLGAYSVIVRDGSNNPVQGVTVSWAVATGGGSIGPATSVTDVNGIATATRVLGNTAGTQTATASVGGLTGSPVTFTATATAGGAFQLSLNSGDGQSAQVGTAVSAAPTVKVSDKFGNAVAGVTVNFAAATGGGAVGGGSPVSDGSGLAAVGTWVLGNIAGSNTLTATKAGLVGSPITFAATGTPRAAYQIAVNGGNGQSGTVNTQIAIPPSVVVRDTFGNAVSGTAVTFAVFSGGGTITGSNPSSNGSGVAQVGTWTLGTTSGSNTLTATASGLVGSPVTFTATGTGGQPSLSTSIITVAAGTVAAGDTTTVTLSSKDAFGNAAQSGHTVTFTLAGAGTSTGTFNPVTDHGDGTYTAIFTGLAAGTARNIGATIDGSDVTTPQPTITVVPGGPTQITISSGNGQSATVNTSVAVAPSALVRDAQNNPVAGVAVTFAIGSGGGSVTGGSATTNASGIATVGKWALGTTAGTNTLAATSTGLAGSPLSFTATGTPGPFSAFASVTTAERDTVAAGSNIAITMQAKDQYGNNLTAGGLAVTFVLNGGTSDGTLGATNDNLNGTYTAAYTGQVAGSADTVSTVANGSPLGTLRPLVRVVPGPALNLISYQGDGQTAMGGTAVAIPPAVQVFDAFGNLVSNALVTFDPSAYGGRVRDTLGAVQLAADVRSINGIATAPAWILPAFAGFSQIHVAIATSSVNFGATGTAPTFLGSVRLGNLLMGISPTSIASSPQNHRTFVGTNGGPGMGPGITVIDDGDTAVAFTSIAPPTDMAVSAANFSLYVVDSQFNQLERRDLFNASFINNQPLGCPPRLVAVADQQNRVYVVDQCNTITAYDPTSFGFINQDFFGGYAGDLAADNQGQVYVANTFGGTIDVYCGGPGSGCGFNNLNFVTNLFPTFGGAPNSVAVDTLRRLIYATTQNGYLHQFDGFCLCEKNFIPLPFKGSGVDVDANTNRIFVTDSSNGEVAIFDGFSFSFLGAFSTGHGARNVVANPNSTKEYVVNTGAGTVSVLLNGSFQTTVARVGPIKGIALNPNQNTMFVAADTSANLILVNMATLKVFDAYPVAPFGTIGGVAVDQLNGFVYATATNLNQLVEFDASGNKVATIAVGSQPGGVAVNQKTSNIYIGDCGDVAAVSGLTHFVTFIGVGGCGRDVAVDTATDSIYVANQGGSVAVIDGATNSVVSFYGIGNAQSVDVDPVQRHLWTTSVFDPPQAFQLSNHAGGSVGGAGNGQWVRVNPTTGGVFVANQSTGLDIYSRDLLTQVFASGSPFTAGGMAINRFTGRVYVTDYFSSMLRVFQN
jgi:adhesin/invasin